MAGEAEEVGAHRLHVGGQVGDVLGAVDQDSAPAAWAASASWRTGVSVPSTFDMAVTPTSFTPSSSRSRSVRSSVCRRRSRQDSGARCPLGSREHEPGHEVGVVLDLGEQDGVALVQVGPAPGVGDEVDRLGDVLGEDDLAGLAPMKRATLPRAAS